MSIYPDDLLDRDWSSVFVDDSFRDAHVWLDGNSFIGDEFIRTTFLWNGGAFGFATDQNAIKGGCKVQLGPDAPRNALPPVLPQCETDEEPLAPFLTYIGHELRPARWPDF